MVHRRSLPSLRWVMYGVFVTAGVTCGLTPTAGAARTQATGSPAGAPARQSGTVASLTPGQVTIHPEKGDTVTLKVDAATRVLLVAPGSTDLTSAQPATLADVAVGDRVLATGAAAGDKDGPWTVRRLIVLKAAAISQRRGEQEAAWAHSQGGIVSSIDGATGTMMVTSGARKITVLTGPDTVVRRYMPGSVKFEDARRSSLAEVHVGDEVRIRGERSGEGTAISVKAQEVIAGSFQQVSGTLSSVNAGSGQVSFKDLRTKKQVTVLVPAQAHVHRLSEEQAQRFAGRSKAQPEAGAGNQAAQAGAGAGAHREGGQDLSQTVAALPELTIADLKPGEAVMVVGTPGESGQVTAITVLAGVEPILAASPNGADVSLTPWSVGGGAPGAEQ